MLRGCGGGVAGYSRTGCGGDKLALGGNKLGGGAGAGAWGLGEHGDVAGTGGRLYRGFCREV